MDPNACLRRFLYALGTADYIEAENAKDDLQRWLRNGGSEPDWSAQERKAFYGFVLPSHAGIYVPTTEEIEEDLEDRMREDFDHWEASE